MGGGMRSILAGLVVGLALAPGLARAQDAQPAPVAESAGDGVDICDLTGCPGPMYGSALVAGMRFRASVGDTPGATVLYGEDIVREQPRSLAELLKSTPVVALGRSLDGGTGRMRGGGPPLLLIDGVVANDPLTGGFDLSGLPVSGFQRVELLAGPQSADWGDGAGSGLIALGEADWPSRGVRGRLSSDGGWAGDLNFGGYSTDAANTRWGVTLNGFGDRSASQAAGGRERDANQALALALTGSRNATLPGLGRMKIAGGLRLTDARQDLDGFDGLGRFVDQGGSARRQSLLAYGRLTGGEPPFGLWGEPNLTVGVYGLRADRGAGRPGYDAWRSTVRYELVAAGFGQSVSGWSLGLERTDAGAAIEGGRRGRQGVTSAYGQWLDDAGVFSAVRLQVRLDLPDGFEPRVSARLSGAWEGYDVMVKGSLGWGYSLPTLAQQLCDLCASPAPRPDLKPEATLGWDLGVAWLFQPYNGPDLTLQAALFGLRRRDVVGLDGGVYRNLGAVRTDGIDLTSTLSLGNARLGLRYVLTDAEDGFAHDRPLGSPRHAAWAWFSYFTDDGDYSLTVRAQSSQLDLDPSTLARRRRDGFATADLNLRFNLRGEEWLVVRLENLADARYQQSLGYGEAGRTLWVGLRTDF